VPCVVTDCFLGSLDKAGPRNKETELNSIEKNINIIKKETNEIKVLIKEKKYEILGNIDSYVIKNN
jgi:hypothetical protein